MKIRLLTGWNGNVKGAELDLDDGQASLLLERAKAELIDPPKAEKPVADKAVKAAPANKSKPKRK